MFFAGINRLSISFSAVVCVSLPTMFGCSNMVSVDKAWNSGEYTTAREVLACEVAGHSEETRHYILDRMRLLNATLADGYPESAEGVANETWEFLREQGVNDDKTVASAVLIEDVRVWKGEPFEQALAYYYIALQKSLVGDWGNAQAAAQQSLFLLKDFGENEEGDQKTTEQIAKEAVRLEQAKEYEEGEYFDDGYQPIETNFALGYLMTGVANQADGRLREAEDNFEKAIKYNKSLRSVVQAIQSRSANTLLIVDYGRCPKKEAYGVDNAFSRFALRTESHDHGISVKVNGRNSIAGYRSACDTNGMAAEHFWNNMEDVRVAKSRIGTALVVTGAAVTTYGAYDDNSAAALIGLGMMIGGAIAKASARANTDYCDVYPQSVYVVPMMVTKRDTRIDLSIGDDSLATASLPAVDPPESLSGLQVIYTRLVTSDHELPWMDSGEVLYYNDHFSGPVKGLALPYILGGDCVRRPSLTVLREYQRAGFLESITLADLENLYVEEGIALTLNDQGGVAGRHVLEGGKSLVPPIPGSTGYLRLFCQKHDPYEPTSDRVRALSAEIAAQLLARQESDENGD